MATLAARDDLMTGFTAGAIWERRVPDPPTPRSGTLLIAVKFPGRGLLRGASRVWRSPLIDNISVRIYGPATTGNCTEVASFGAW
jgi:hypothetical protein